MIFCTLFNSHYLSRGKLLYDSLSKHCAQFHLYIFAFDQLAVDALETMNLEHATIISLEAFENSRLLSIKSTRTTAEYCWTCTPWTIKYVLDTYNEPSCTYLDADLYFYADPKLLMEEVKPSFSVVITPHRYTKEYDQSSTSGIYCVQFVYFKNNNDGLIVLNKWAEDCFNWCYNRIEEGKFGDQKYLDTWPSDFPGIVWILNHLGGGVAPWNVQQYSFYSSDNLIFGIETASQETFQVVFYHFHAIKFEYGKFIYNRKIIVNIYSGYALPVTAKKHIYRPYIFKLLKSSLHYNSTFKIPLISSSEPVLSFSHKFVNTLKMLKNRLIK